MLQFWLSGSSAFTCTHLFILEIPVLVWGFFGGKFQSSIRSSRQALKWDDTHFKDVNIKQTRFRFSAVATVCFRDDIRMRSSTDSDCTESLSSPVWTLAKSNQIICWTRRKPCHPSSRDPDLSCSPVLSLSSYFRSLHPPAVLPLQHLTFPACAIWLHFLYPHSWPDEKKSAQHWMDTFALHSIEKRSKWQRDKSRTDFI